MKRKTATVMAGNTEAFLLQYSDRNCNSVDPTSIEVKFYESYTGKVYLQQDVTDEIQKDSIGKYRYFYTIPLESDNLVVETTAMINGSSFVDRAVVKVINSRNMKYPSGNPK